MQIYKEINMIDELTKTCIADTLTVNFEQVDSWFFRESRPHGSTGANALSSVFPPPTRTLMGALRSHIGNSYFANHPGKSWHDIDRLADLKAVIGNANRLGSMQPRGVFLQKSQQVYLPAPRNICYKFENNNKHYIAMRLSDNIYETDVGESYLPIVPQPDKQNTVILNFKKVKPMEKTWLSQSAWEQVLAGTVKSLADDTLNVQNNNAFVSDEYRLGIQVNHDNKSVEQGILYQTTHLRLANSTSICMPITYNALEFNALINKNFIKKTHLIRLGGEGRMAGVKLNNHPSCLPKAPKQLTTIVNNKKRFMLYLVSKLAMQQEKEIKALTDGTLETTKNWLPAGFYKSEIGWYGNIRGIEVNILSACMGKAHREGGWDLQNHRPRAINNYIPAGTAFFIEVDKKIDDDELIVALHGHTFHKNDSWGEGIMLLGRIIM